MNCIVCNNKIDSKAICLDVDKLLFHHVGKCSDELMAEIGKKSYLKYPHRTFYPDIYVRFPELKSNLKEHHIGRPKLGVTKKLSVTLSSDTWTWIEECINSGHAKNQSEFLREIIYNAYGIDRCVPEIREFERFVPADAELDALLDQGF